MIKIDVERARVILLALGKLSHVAVMQMSHGQVVQYFNSTEAEILEIQERLPHLPGLHESLWSTYEGIHALLREPDVSTKALARTITQLRIDLRILSTRVNVELQRAA